MTWKSLIKSALDGSIFTTSDGDIASDGAYITGREGEASIMIPPGSADKIAYHVDFIGQDTGNYVYLSNDTGQSSALSATETNGVFELFSSPSATTTLAAGGNEQISATGKLQWKADQGPGKDGLLRMGARVRLDSVSRTTNRVHAFVGFTDVASVEHPAFDTGANLQANATDYVGIMFAPGGDTGYAGVANGTVVNLDKTIEAGKFYNLEVVIRHNAGDTGGVATFLIDGQELGSISSPVGSSTALTDIVSAFTQDTGAQRVGVDYINVSALRDTGS